MILNYFILSAAKYLHFEFDIYTNLVVTDFAIIFSIKPNFNNLIKSYTNSTVGLKKEFCEILYFEFGGV